MARVLIPQIRKGALARQVGSWVRRAFICSGDRARNAQSKNAEVGPSSGDCRGLLLTGNRGGGIGLSSDP
eukprot:10286362-Alexandrium_andersonii.AAC.1